MYNIEQSAKHAELNNSTNAMTSMTIYTNPLDYNTSYLDFTHLLQKKFQGIIIRLK